MINTNSDLCRCADLVGMSVAMLIMFYAAQEYIHDATQGHDMKTPCYAQNRKYIITYRNAARRPSHGHRQNAQRIGEVRPCGLQVTRADRQTDRQKDKLTDSPQYSRSNYINNRWRDAKDRPIWTIETRAALSTCNPTSAPARYTSNVRQWPIS